MRKININNPEELKKFKMETSGFVSTYGFPYRLDDLTEKGANYTVFCPLRWKSAFPPAKLRKILCGDGYADVIKVEYIDFVKEGIEDEGGIENFVEYIPKDAFIEKACMKLKKLMYGNLMFQGRLHREEVINNFVEDFKKAMEE